MKKSLHLLVQHLTPPPHPPLTGHGGAFHREPIGGKRRFPRPRLRPRVEVKVNESGGSAHCGESDLHTVLHGGGFIWLPVSQGNGGKLGGKKYQRHLNKRLKWWQGEGGGRDTLFYFPGPLSQRATRRGASQAVCRHLRM